MLQLSRAFVIGFALFHYGLVHAAFIYIETSRLAGAFGQIISPDNPGSQSESAQSDTAGVFNENRAISLASGDSFFVASAAQASYIGSNVIFMKGQAAAQVGAAPADFVEAYANHSIVVRFELTEARRYRLDGVVSESGNFANAFVQFYGGNGAVFESINSDGSAPFEIHQEFYLVPGMYTLSAGSSVAAFSFLNGDPASTGASVALVPVPAISTLALLAAGLGVMGFCVRGRA